MHRSNFASTAFPTLAVLVLLTFSASTAQARLHPFLFGGGQHTRTEKEDFDFLLDPITVRGDANVWEAGIGLRFYSSKDLGGLPLDRSAVGIPRWEVRPRLGWSGGDLGKTRVVPPRRGTATFSFEESFEFTSWQIGASFLVNLHRTFGLFAGPSVQVVDFDAERDWEGEIPQFCGSCGDGKDRTELRYGLLEVGVQLRAPRWPVGAELYWIPKRVELSTTRRTTEGQTYSANFADLASAFGGRVFVQF